MAIFEHMGVLAVTPQMVAMWLISLTLLYLAISKKYEPLLLLPIGFGILLANLPLTDLMQPDEGLIWRFYHYGIEWEVIPPLIFLGLGALTDFGPLLSQPRLIFLGAAAQAGVYVTFFRRRSFSPPNSRRIFWEPAPLQHTRIWRSCRSFSRRSCAC
jgi:oxaloacetate decarboxylase beta subunit